MPDFPALKSSPTDRIGIGPVIVGFSENFESNLPDAA
jgi:hypothetical protein